MGAVNENGYLSCTATAAAIAKNVRVTFDSNGLVSADAGTNGTSVGSTIEDVAASGNVTVKLWSAPGAHFLTASGAITRGAKVYPDASGKITATAGMLTAIGIAQEAATADGDIIRVLPIR